jgi:arylsulfatase
MKPSPKNVLFVISDQHLATCSGHEGHPQAITPNMDRLAREGVSFRHAYTQNPICTPSRVSLLSGQYCHNHGYFGLSGPHPGNLPSFLSHFRQHGYRTAGIGKLHTPNDPSDWLLDHVDDYAESYGPGRGVEFKQSAYFKYLDELGLRSKEDSIALQEFPGVQQDEARPSFLPYEHSVESWCVRRAIAFMEDSRAVDKPFCMEVSLPRPHQCYTPDQRFWDMYPEDLELPPTIDQDPSGRPPHFRQMVEKARTWEGLIEPKGFEQVRRRVWRGYLGCITQVDHALGELLDYLDRTGQAADTIVIYGSDHGAYSGTFGVPEKAPGICSEAVCRVPFLWRVPGVTASGHVSRALVENIDLVPTITELCDLPAMDTAEGVNLTGLLQGGEEPVKSVAVTEHAWSKSIRWGDWRMVHYQPEMFGSEDWGELYRISEDPDETRNLYRDPEFQNVVHEGRRLLLEWLIRTTRVKTVLPPPRTKGPGSVPLYPTAEDGKESGSAGPAARLRANELNYL